MALPSLSCQCREPLSPTRSPLAGHEHSSGLSPAQSLQSKGGGQHSPSFQETPLICVAICMAITFNKTNQLFCHKIIQTHKQTLLNCLHHSPTHSSAVGVLPVFVFLPLRVQWHPPCRNSSQSLPLRLERHREGRAPQQLPHTQPNHHMGMCLLIRAGKQQGNSTAPTEHGRLGHKPQDKNRVLFDPHPLAAAPSLPQELGDRQGHLSLCPLCCKGGLASSPQHLQRGPRMGAVPRARALERFVPAHGCHIQLQAHKGQNPLVLHLKQKRSKMTFRK